MTSQEFAGQVCFSEVFLVGATQNSEKLLRNLRHIPSQFRNLHAADSQIKTRNVTVTFITLISHCYPPRS